MSSKVWADDIVGLMRIHVYSNESTVVSYPFLSFGSGVLEDLLSGPFVDDDEITYVSNILSIKPSPSPSFDAYLYGRVPTNDFLELELDIGENFVSYGYPSLSCSTAALPSGVSIAWPWQRDCGDGFLPWRTPVVLTNETAHSILWRRNRPYSLPTIEGPRLTRMMVDPLGVFVEFGLNSFGRVSDVLRLVDSKGISNEKAWVHRARLPPSSIPLVWRDSLQDLVADEAFYLISDASCDRDGDGLSDAVEYYVYGTSPTNLDTDGDGVSDGLELAWGTDPLVTDAPLRFLFHEFFDPPSISIGDIAGQNGWTSSISGAAIIQTNVVFNGTGALELQPVKSDDTDEPIETHAITGAPQVVWLDVRIMPEFSLISSNPSDAIVRFEFDRFLHPVMSDGNSCVTNVNVSVSDEKWIRCTARLDFAEGFWDFYIDGILVGEKLALQGSATSPSEIAIGGSKGFVDDIILSSIRPEGLSADGDALPDEWEFKHFGTFDCDGSGDADQDGLNDLDEFRAGTDPFSPDTDGDGLPDLWEVSKGLSPTNAADVADDPDGDGLNNELEYELGTDPLSFEPDPRVVSPGLRVEFRRMDPSLDTLPNFAALESPFALTTSSVVDYPTRPWLDGGTPPGDHFSCLIEGFIQVSRSGKYVFYVTADDGVSLRIDGVEIVRDPTIHSARTMNGTMELETGWHTVEILYYEYEGSEVLKLEWEGPRQPRTVIPPERFFHVPRNVFPALSSTISLPYCLEGELVTIDALASDIDGTIARVAVLDSDVELVSSNEPSCSFELSDLTLGLHNLLVVAWDDLNSAVTNRYTLEVRPFPKGYTSGFTVAYYKFTSELSKMPDFTRLTPIATGLINQISFPSTYEQWEGVPTTLIDQFGAVIEGSFWIEEAGIYDWTLSSDDGSSLYLDGTRVIHNDGIHSMTAMTTQIPLSRGLHALRLEYFENSGAAGLELKMAKHETTPAQLPMRNIFHRIDVSDDSDGDGMPDWWESLFGLNPLDSLDAVQDPDGDGLINLDEFRHGTNPHKSDTDCDGMPDEWEVENNTSPYVDDALGDKDADGLLNRDEFRAGTRPDLADTDGDGFGDGQEVRNVRSDPRAADIAWQPQLAGDPILPTNFVASTGSWRQDADGSVCAAERAGSLTWSLELPEGGADALAVRLSQHEKLSDCTEFDISLFVDGLFVCRQVVSAPWGSPTVAYFFLPEAASGRHEFRLVWHNWEVNTFLSVHDLRFVRFGGPDVDGNGVADWRDNRTANASGVDELPLESLVSPVCIEGHDLWRDSLEVEVEYPHTNAAFATVKTVGDGFYADIPLPEEGRAVVSLADRPSVASFAVEWREFDVSSGLFETNALSVREGDSLRLAGIPDSESQMTVYRADRLGSWQPVTNWTQRTATAYVFDEQGTYLVEAVSDGLLGADLAFARVDVVRSLFPKRNPAILIDESAVLACPDLSPRNVLEHDVELSVAAEVNMSGGMNLSLSTSADRDLGLVSRIEEEGAISDAVQVTPIWADNGTYYRVVQTYPDGSQLTEVSLLFGAIAPNMTVDLEIFVSGVTFEDGTRMRTLTTDDFDENGHYTIRFIKARGVTTSVCHRTYIYQDGKLLYTNK